MKRKSFIKTLILSSGVLLLSPGSIFPSSIDKKNITALTIFNNIGNKNNFINQWGLSIWIEDRNDALLFDTGGNASILWNNIKKAGIDINKLSKIIISHNHSDHTNGLSFILDKTNFKPEVYVPDHVLTIFKQKNPEVKFTGVKDPMQINSYTWSTGQLAGSYNSTTLYEQSIIIIQNNLIYLFTGCAHPGIIEIVEKTKKVHPDKEIYLAGGGLHLLQYSKNKIKIISDKLKNLQVKRLAPSHCTGESAINILKKEWKNKFIDFYNGNSIKI